MSGTVRTALWILAALAAVAGVWGIVRGANPLWTLLAGLVAGAAFAAAQRRGEGR